VESVDNVMVRYLLGSLSTDEALELERQYFSDDQLFEELEIVETELIESYLRGQLSDKDRKQFQAVFLRSPQRRQRVDEVRSMLAAIREVSLHESTAAHPGWLRQGVNALQSLFSPPIRLGYAVAMVALTVALAVMLTQSHKLHSDLAHLQTENARLSEQISGSPYHVDQFAVASIELKPQTRALGAINNLVISRDTQSVQLRLLLETDEYKVGYSLVIKSIEGKEVERVSRIRSRRGNSGLRILEVSVPADSLDVDTYIVTLFGLTASGKEEELAAYSFQVNSR